MTKHPKYQTKKGGASIYVTIFVALIISVVTLSFARLAISELSKSSDTDLNQSAYDSALAGVEDAKIAISACLKEGHTLAECKIASTNLDDCNYFLHNGTKYINRTETQGAVFIEESSNQSGKNTSQAYTCVTINNILADYLGELNSEYRIRMIPLKTQNPEDLKNLSSVVLSWYDNTNGARQSKCSGDNCYFGAKGSSDAPIPPTIIASILQAGENFNRDQLINTATNKYGSVVLYPNGTRNDKPQVIGAGEFKSVVDGGTANKPISVSCYATDAFACSAELQIPTLSGTQRYNNSTYLLVATPYDNLSTAFKVEMKVGDNTVNFYEAQVAIDSTGRANDVYRRVEARVDTIDTYFPYPVYGLETISAASSNGTINKNFWTTRNCWLAQDGSTQSCDNSSGY